MPTSRDTAKVIEFSTSYRASTVSRRADRTSSPSEPRAHHRLRLLRAAGHRRLRRLRRQLPPRAGARGRRRHRRRRGAGHAHARARRAGPDAALQLPRRLNPTAPAPSPARPTPCRWRAVKRHLLVTNDFPPKVGGIQNYLWDLWSRLDPSSFVVLTASSDDGAAAFDAAQAERGIRIERVPGSILFFPTPGALAAVRAARQGARDRPGPARPCAAARPPRAPPRRPLRRHPPRRRGDGARPPARLAGRARPGAARGAARRVGRRLPGGRGPPRRRRTSRRRWSRSRPGVDAGAIVPLKAAERRAARARARAARARGRCCRASAAWSRARAWTCSSRRPTASPPRTRTSWWPSPATAGSWTTCGAWPARAR